MNCFLRAPFAAIGAFVDALYPVDVTRAERMLVEKEAEQDALEPCPCAPCRLDRNPEVKARLGEAWRESDIVQTLEMYPPLPQSSAVSASDADRPEVVSVDPPAPTSGHLTFVDWAVPAICDVLAAHHPIEKMGGGWFCHTDPTHFREDVYSDAEAWREHVAPLIAGRLESCGVQRNPLPPVGRDERRCGVEHCDEPISWHDSMSTWVHTNGFHTHTPTPS